VTITEPVKPRTIEHMVENINPFQTGSCV